jgi:hypothetical protein
MFEAVIIVDHDAQSTIGTPNSAELTRNRTGQSMRDWTRLGDDRQNFDIRMLFATIPRSLDAIGCAGDKHPSRKTAGQGSIEAAIHELLSVGVSCCEPSAGEVISNRSLESLAPIV